MVSYDLLFHLFPTFDRLPHVPKGTRLKKIHISTRKFFIIEGNFSPGWINTLGHLILDTMSNSPMCFTMLTNTFPSNQIPHMVDPFYWFLYIDKKDFQRGRVKEDRQQLISFKHKGKHKIGCSPKSLLILTAFEV